IVAWLVTGPLFHYSDTWQLVINTGTTIVTFLMVFLIQRTQNKDALAVHLKLNEIVAAVHGASNRLIDLEDLSAAALLKLHRYYRHLALMAKRDGDLGQSHSVEEAEALHRRQRSATPVALAPPPPPPPETGRERPRRSRISSRLGWMRSGNGPTRWKPCLR